MAKYKLYISKDEKSFSWIVVDNGRLIMNPTENDLNGAILKHYNKTNICPRCRKDKYNDSELTDKSILYPGQAHREKDKYGNITGNWICKLHYKRDYELYDPNSYVNTIKSMRDRRTGNLDPNSNQAKGDKFEKLSGIYFGIDSLNIKYNNYETSIDHSPIPNDTFINIGGKSVDLSGNIPQTRGRYYNKTYGAYPSFGNFEREWHKKFDIIICWCASTDGKTIERGYIILKKEIYDSNTKTGKMNITIVKNPSKGGKYEQYRITDDKELININEIWNQINKNEL